MSISQRQFYRKIVSVFTVLVLVSLPLKAFAAGDISTAFYEFIRKRNTDLYSFYTDEKFDEREYLTDYNNIVCTDEAVIKLSGEITGKCKSDYDKVKAVYSWITHNIYYDKDYESGLKESSNTEVGDIIDKRYCVCEGISTLASSLLRAVGIPCRKVHGYGSIKMSTDEMNWYMKYTNLVNHSWNEAYVQGRWLIFDCTWDMKNYIFQGEKHSENPTENYFDMDFDEFCKHHFISSYKEPIRYCGFEWSYNGEVKIGKYIGEDERAVIPSDMNFTRITRSVFRGNDKIKEVVIPDFVTTIDSKAFENCVSLEKITLPTSLAELEDNTFDGCISLKSVIVPEGVMTIGNYCFNNCVALSDVVLNSSINVIKSGTFYGCKGLSHIVLKEGVKKLCTNAFAGCDELSYIVFPESLTEISSGAFEHLPDDVYYLGEYDDYCNINGVENLDGCHIHCGEEKLPVSAVYENQNHNFTCVTVTATAKNRGCKIYTCTDCGEVYNDYSCSCICHGNGVAYIIYNCLLPIMKNSALCQKCRCGCEHYEV